MPSILFAQVPCFYAEVERAADPSLAERPVIVGGDPRKRGLVQSASAEAQAAGVVQGMSVLEALERCPSARAVRTNMRRYREVSGLLRSRLRAEVEALEPMGLDAAFLVSRGATGDASDATPESLAGRLIDRVRVALDLPLRVGIARVKFLAKLACEEAEPGEVNCVRDEEEAAFLHALPVERLPGVGPRTVATLHALGVRTVAQLVALGASRLEAELGNHGLRLLELARGEDPSPVRAARHPNTLSREFTFKEAQLDMSALWEKLQSLAQVLEETLRRQALEARSIVVKVRYEDQEMTTRRRTLGRSVASASDIYAVASDLLDRTHAGTRPIRLVGISLSGVVASAASDRQLDLFPDSG